MCDNHADFLLYHPEHIDKIDTFIYKLTLTTLPRVFSVGVCPRSTSLSQSGQFRTLLEEKLIKKQKLIRAFSVPLSEEHNGQINALTVSLHGWSSWCWSEKVQLIYRLFLLQNLLVTMLTLYCYLTKLVELSQP